MNISAIRHDERYDATGYAAAIDAYDTEIMEYRKHLGRGDSLTWSCSLGNSCNTEYFPQVRPVAAMHGLLNDK